MRGIKYGFFGLLIVTVAGAAWAAGGKDSYVSSRDSNVSSRNNYTSSRTNYTSSREKLAKQKSEDIGVPYDAPDREYDQNATINVDRHKRATEKFEREAEQAYADSAEEEDELFDGAVDGKKDAKRFSTIESGKSRRP